MKEAFPRNDNVGYVRARQIFPEIVKSPGWNRSLHSETGEKGLLFLVGTYFITHCKRGESLFFLKSLSSRCRVFPSRFIPWIGFNGLSFQPGLLWREVPRRYRDSSCCSRSTQCRHRRLLHRINSVHHAYILLSVVFFFFLPEGVWSHDEWVHAFMVRLWSARMSMNATQSDHAPFCHKMMRVKLTIIKSLSLNIQLGSPTSCRKWSSTTFWKYI